METQSTPTSETVGEEMHRWIADMLPFRRSLTGEGVRQTLGYLAEIVPGLTTHEVPTNTTVFDWTIPDEWTLRDAYIADPAGRRLVDLAESDLHVVGYSEPVDAVLSRAELERHLHSLPDLRHAIPYVTSYYSRTWGFCLTQHHREALGEGPFHVVIDSTLAPGSLSYADVVLPGRKDREVLLSSYICHPSMANNELSGPVVLAALGRWLASLPDRRFSYRLFLGPETIGAITYLARHVEHLKQQVVAGFVLTCLGDERAWSVIHSPEANTLADRVAVCALEGRGLAFDAYDFLQRGSDERQYCAPHVGLPVCSVMRSKHNGFPEYHTSLDDLTLVTPTGLQESFELYCDMITLLEANRTYIAKVPCEPQLGRRGLYPNLSTRGASFAVSDLANFLAFADGRRDLLALARRIELSALDCAAIARRLTDEGLIEAIAEGSA